jgi:hypothetical protein
VRSVRVSITDLIPFSIVYFMVKNTLRAERFCMWLPNMCGFSYRVLIGTTCVQVFHSSNRILASKARGCVSGIHGPRRIETHKGYTPRQQIQYTGKIRSLYDLACIQQNKGRMILESGSSRAYQLGRVLLHVKDLVHITDTLEFCTFA